MRPKAALAGGEVDVVLIDGDTVLQERTGFSGNDLVDTLQRAAGSVRLQRLVEENGQAAADVIAILSSSPLEVRASSGEDPEADIRPVIAYAGLLLMYIAILSYGSWTLTGVTEEKNNRVVEVLLATLRPGNCSGARSSASACSRIGQFVLTVGFAFVLVNLTDALDVPAIPIDGLFFLVLVVHPRLLGVFGFIRRRRVARQPPRGRPVGGFSDDDAGRGRILREHQRLSTTPPRCWPGSPPSSRSRLRSWCRSGSRSTASELSSTSPPCWLPIVSIVVLVRLVRSDLRRRAVAVWQAGEAEGSMAVGGTVSSSHIEVERARANRPDLAEPAGEEECSQRGHVG